MAVKVVDASAIAALIFREDEANAVSDLVRHHQLYAPTLFSFELSNVCVTKMRRHPSDREKFALAFRQRGKLNIREWLVDYDGVLALAEDHRLSAYDASYLWLSRRLDVELVTLDKRLAAAAANA